jgi:hypothetical protein
MAMMSRIIANTTTASASVGRSGFTAPSRWMRAWRGGRG